MSRMRGHCSASLLRRRQSLAVGVALCTLVVTGCATRAYRGDSVSEPCAAPLSAYTRHALYFGLSSPLVPGRVITPQIWSSFSSEVLTRYFAAGMTVVDANGEWRRPDGSHYGEPTKVVIHLAAIEQEASTDAAIQEVIAEAKRRFGYRSVLWERSAACVAF
jgi:hypothetical protein